MRLQRYVDLTNDCIAARRPDTAIGIHVCRGNSKSGWIAEGGCERIAATVLGLVTTKFGALESSHDLLRRIDEASRMVPLDDLAISPQCGFASTVEGNIITPDDQWCKLERVVQVSKMAWK